MSDRVRIELVPLAQSFTVARGTPLQDVLFAYGVEFPCGGRGNCDRCRVKVLDTGEWIQSCKATADRDLRLEVAQWETAILADNTEFAFTPREGQGIAIDLGTTTLVAQAVDLRTAHVLGVRSGLNPQVAYGSDVMSRVEYALSERGRRKLQQLIRRQIAGMIRELGGSPAVIVGNTVMHHLYCGIDVEPLAHCPFEPVEPVPELDGGARFLPWLGGFVGSDILAGVLATRMHESERLIALLDLGTNGEIVIGNRERLVCASTAAGPAFEGGRISMGMRAATGAIVEVGSQLECRVLADAVPRGICGSGLVDAVAAGLDLGLIDISGRLREPLALAPPVVLTQRDVRELQMAKAAIAAGIEIVLRKWGARAADIDTLYLAGAFGNYVNRASARRIGLLDFPLEKIQPAGNTALLGAKLALFDDIDLAGIRRRTEHISLASDAAFQEIYVESMLFPVGQTP